MTRQFDGLRAFRPKLRACRLPCARPEEDGFSYSGCSAANGFALVRRSARNDLELVRRFANNGSTLKGRFANNGSTLMGRFANNGFTLMGRFAKDGSTLMGRFANNGFTLIELMVVITIIGLASAAVVWAIPDPRRRLVDDGERFAARARAAHDLAIIEAQPVSIWISAGGYGFDARRGGAWSPIGDKPFQVAQWSKGVSATIDNGAQRDRMMFDSTGLPDRPLDVRLVRGNSHALVRIGGSGAVAAGG